MTGYRVSKNRNNPGEAGEVQRFIQIYAPENYNHVHSQMGAGFKKKITTDSYKNNVGAHANIERDADTRSRRRDHTVNAGSVPSRQNPVHSFSEPLVYLGKVLKLKIDTPDGTRILKGDEPFEMFESLKKNRLYIIGKKYIQPVMVFQSLFSWISISKNGVVKTEKNRFKEIGK